MDVRLVLPIFYKTYISDIPSLLLKICSEIGNLLG